MGDRLVEYFAAVGLDPAAPPVAATPLDAAEQAIVDVTVVNQSKKDPVPEGYEVIRKSVGGYDAALNGGAIFGDRCYLAVKRGPAHAALGDIDVIFADKEHPKPHHEVLASAVSGRMADLHGGARLKTALTLRRRGVIQTLSGLYDPERCVVDIAVLIESQGEMPPPGYYVIPTNTNRSVFGHRVYICFCLGPSAGLAYVGLEPAILDRLPRVDRPDVPFVPSLAMFAMPEGVGLRHCPDAQAPLPEWSTFVLTDAAGDHVYGGVLTISEPLDQDHARAVEASHILSLRGAGWLPPSPTPTPQPSPAPGTIPPPGADTAGEGNGGEDAEAPGLATWSEAALSALTVSERGILRRAASTHRTFVTKSLVLVSRRPFYEPFKATLKRLYQISLSPSPLPLEQFVAQVVTGIPLPTPGGRLQLDWGSAAEPIEFRLPPPRSLPLLGTSMLPLFATLGPGTVAQVLLRLLTEQPVVLVCQHANILAAVAECLVALLFPFQWSCPYVPVLPMQRRGMLEAPCPFLVGLRPSHLLAIADDLGVPARARTRPHTAAANLPPSPSASALERATASDGAKFRVMRGLAGAEVANASARTDRAGDRKASHASARRESAEEQAAVESAFARREAQGVAEVHSAVVDLTAGRSSWHVTRSADRARRPVGPASVSHQHRLYRRGERESTAGAASAADEHGDRGSSPPQWSAREVAAMVECAIPTTAVAVDLDHNLVLQGCDTEPLPLPIPPPFYSLVERWDKLLQGSGIAPGRLPLKHLELAFALHSGEESGPLAVDGPALANHALRDAAVRCNARLMHDYRMHLRLPLGNVGGARGSGGKRSRRGSTGAVRPDEAPPLHNTVRPAAPTQPPGDGAGARASGGSGGSGSGHSGSSSSNPRHSQQWRPALALGGEAPRRADSAGSDAGTSVSGDSPSAEPSLSPSVRGAEPALSDFFSSDSFISSAPSSLRPTLRALSITQAFARFVEHRTLPSEEDFRFLFFDRCLDVLDNVFRSRRIDYARTLQQLDTSLCELVQRGKSGDLVLRGAELLLRHEYDACLERLYRGHAIRARSGIDRCRSDEGRGTNSPAHARRGAMAVWRGHLAAATDALQHWIAGEEEEAEGAEGAWEGGESWGIGGLDGAGLGPASDKAAPELRRARSAADLMPVRVVGLPSGSGLSTAAAAATATVTATGSVAESESGGSGSTFSPTGKEDEGGAEVQNGNDGDNYGGGGEAMTSSGGEGKAGPGTEGDEGCAAWPPCPQWPILRSALLPPGAEEGYSPHPSGLRRVQRLEQSRQRERGAMFGSPRLVLRTDDEAAISAVVAEEGFLSGDQEWACSLLGAAFGVWLACGPTFVARCGSPAAGLISVMHALQEAVRSKAALGEASYRAAIVCCARCGPLFAPYALDVFRRMRAQRIVPSAVTAGQMTVAMQPAVARAMTGLASPPHSTRTPRWRQDPRRRWQRAARRVALVLRATTGVETRYARFGGGDGRVRSGSVDAAGGGRPRAWGALQAWADGLDEGPKGPTPPPLLRAGSGEEWKQEEKEGRNEREEGMGADEKGEECGVDAAASDSGFALRGRRHSASSVPPRPMGLLTSRTPATRSAHTTPRHRPLALPGDGEGARPGAASAPAPPVDDNVSLADVSLHLGQAAELSEADPAGEWAEERSSALEGATPRGGSTRGGALPAAEPASPDSASRRQGSEEDARSEEDDAADAWLSSLAPRLPLSRRQLPPHVVGMWLCGWQWGERKGEGQGSVYEEEVMGGWNADESSMTSAVAGSPTGMVPLLRFAVMRFGGRRVGEWWAVEGEGEAGEQHGGEGPAAGEAKAAPSPLARSSAARGREEGPSPSTTASSAAALSSPRGRDWDRSDRVVGAISGYPLLPPRAAVPYLSPLALRRQMEHALSTEGEAALSRAHLRLRYPSVYWNLVWYCARLRLPLPLALDEGFAVTLADMAAEEAEEGGGEAAPAPGGRRATRPVWERSHPGRGASDSEEPHIAEEVLWLGWTSRELAARLASPFLPGAAISAAATVDAPAVARPPLGRRRVDLPLARVAAHLSPRSLPRVPGARESAWHVDGEEPAVGILFRIHEAGLRRDLGTAVRIFLSARRVHASATRRTGEYRVFHRRMYRQLLLLCANVEPVRFAVDEAYSALEARHGRGVGARSRPQSQAHPSHAGFHHGVSAEAPAGPPSDPDVTQLRESQAERGAAAEETDSLIASLEVEVQLAAQRALHGAAATVATAARWRGQEAAGDCVDAYMWQLCRGRVCPRGAMRHLARPKAQQEEEPPAKARARAALELLGLAEWAGEESAALARVEQAKTASRRSGLANARLRPVLLRKRMPIETFDASLREVLRVLEPSWADELCPGDNPPLRRALALRRAVGFL